MKCRLSILLLCALAGFAQALKQAPEARTFDAVATDAAGKPVPGLTAEDFEVTQDGAPRRVDSLEWCGTPRQIVLIVDDLGLSPERALATQSLLQRFVADQLAPDDAAALLRTSSGAGWQQPLVTDRRPLMEQIDRIQPLGHGLSGAAAASALWQSIRSAVEGLRSVPGRKAVVLISEHLDAPLARGSDPDYARNGIRAAAHAGMAVLYTVDPRGPAEPPRDSALVWLVRETGGLAAPDLAAVMRDQQGYYVFGFHPGGEGAASTPVVLKLRNKILGLRWRFGFLSPPDGPRGPVPPGRGVAIDRALKGATEGSDLRVRVTPLFAGFTRNGAAIEVLVKIDVNNLSDMRSLKVAHQLDVEVHVAVYNDAGKLAGPPGQGYDLMLIDHQYERAKAEGLVYATRLTVPSAGGYQVRAAVIDGLSDRCGSAMQFIEIPAVNQGAFAVSGIVLNAGAEQNATEGIRLAQETAAVRQFKTGAPIAFTYSVFNSTLGPAKESRLRVKTNIYATGRQVYDGRPVDLDFPAATSNVRSVNGKVQLDSSLSAGEYVLEVEAADLLAKEAAPRVAWQYITFEVR